MLKLGVIVKDEKIVNHRTLLKICLNPLLRVFGCVIGSTFTSPEKDGKFIKYEFIRKYDKPKLNIFRNYYRSIFYK